MADGAKGNYNLSFYEDEVVNENGHWLFRKRVYQTRYADDHPLAGIKFDIE